MEATARARFVRMTPRKARQVADLIRGKTVNQALSILLNVPRISSREIEKTLDSAVANAVQKSEGVKLDIDELTVSHVVIDNGPTLKRFRHRARGRATRVRHRSSHITVTVSTAPAGGAVREG
ncbi:50S ribosomal protein L22 [Candidatus Fermentibacteria bacterium]|nr:50S ribosomal protein L22 [Candidatus Fermentibacteria bacterium]